MQVSAATYDGSLRKVMDLASSNYCNLPTATVHPSEAELQNASRSIYRSLPIAGCGLDAVTEHLLSDICPGLSRSPSPRYYGFVTGGSTPAAQLADFVTSICDQNVQVHLPRCSVSTSVEDGALRMVLDLLGLSAKDWPGRTLTTGATASNLLGLACGRNHVLGKYGLDVGENGLGGSCCHVFCVSAHASIRKSAGILGIGRRMCLEIPDKKDPFGVTFDLEALERCLAKNRQQGIGSIVVASLGEVNTGLSTPHLDLVSLLCKKYQAWLHIDAAFAIFAGLIEPLERLLDSLPYADSICVDGHKWLNVPYDCAMFYTKYLHILKDVCASGPAAYLTSAAQSDENEEECIQSPLHVGIENSRRFRALPLYASLVAYGKQGYAEMIRRNIEFIREIDAWMRLSKWYEVFTPQPANTIGENLAHGKHETTNILLFGITLNVPDNLKENLE